MIAEIPQEQYRTVTSPPRGATNNSIEFWVYGRRGINLLEAMRGNFVGLDDPSTAVMHATGAKISFRLEVLFLIACIRRPSLTPEQWHGYPPFSAQKSAHRKNGKQSKERIAQQVAEVVRGPRIFISSVAVCHTNPRLSYITREQSFQTLDGKDLSRCGLPYPVVGTQQLNACSHASQLRWLWIS